MILNTSLDNTPVMSLHSGSQLGVVSGLIIDPRQLQIYALYISDANINGPSVLHINDILEIGALGIIVNSSDEIMPISSDLVRLQEVINLKFELIGKNVVDDTNRKLGRVAEYSIESDSFYIQQIYIGQSLMKNLLNSSVIVSRNQITEINDTTIVVKSGSVPVSSGLTQFVNPFKKSPGPATTD